MIKCIVCGQDILGDSQFIEGNYYHNNCIDRLRKEKIFYSGYICGLEKIIYRLYTDKELSTGDMYNLISIVDKFEKEEG